MKDLEKIYKSLDIDFDSNYLKKIIANDLINKLSQQWKRYFLGLSHL